MDPITLTVAAFGVSIISALGGLGAAAAPVAGLAMTAGPAVTGATVLAAPAIAGAAAGSAAPAAMIASDPHASRGAQNGIAVAVNQAQQDFAGSVNGLQIPGVPQISYN